MNLQSSKAQGRSYMRPIYTIGYEGHTVDSFLSQLQKHNIERVIDIRRVPQSRKPGFSKSGLASALGAIGIAYTHIVDLGTPPALREKLKQTGDYEDFFEQLFPYLATHPEAIETALDLALSQP